MRIKKIEYTQDGDSYTTTIHTDVGSFRTVYVFPPKRLRPAPPKGLTLCSYCKRPGPHASSCEGCGAPVKP